MAYTESGYIGSTRDERTFDARRPLSDAEIARIQAAYDIAKVAVGSLSTEIDDHLALRIHDESQTWLDAHKSAIEEETTLHLLNMSFAYVKDDKRSNALHRMNAGLEPMLENRRRFVEALRLQITPPREDPMGHMRDVMPLDPNKTIGEHVDTLDQLTVTTVSAQVSRGLYLAAMKLREQAGATRDTPLTLLTAANGELPDDKATPTLRNNTVAHIADIATIRLSIERAYDDLQQDAQSAA